MADASKLKTKRPRGGLGVPPGPDEVATSLNAPETLAFATRVTPAFDQEIRDIAEREGLKLVEVLEKAVEAYKEKQGY